VVLKEYLLDGFLELFNDQYDVASIVSLKLTSFDHLDPDGGTLIFLVLFAVDLSTHVEKV
jgi:hypothetical protein